MNHSKGLTLLELIVGLLISSILLLNAIPNLREFLDQAEAKSISSKIRRSAAAARHHAIMLDYPITLCGVDAQLTCTRNNFNEIALFIDKDVNRAVNSNDTIIHLLQVNSDEQLNLRASFRRSYIQFNEDGSASQAGSFIFCNRQTPSANKRVTISMSGRAYSARDRNGDGIVELTNGQPISC